MTSSLSALSPQMLTPDGRSAVTGGAQLWSGTEGFSFKDLLDAVNPLQHIPVVSTLYRDATGDTISAGAQMIGGAVFGGLPGLALSAANAALEAETGKDAGATALAMLRDAAHAMPTPDTPTPLEADAGEALLSIALAGEQAKRSPQPPAKPESSFIALNTLKSSPGFADPTLGLQDRRKGEQFRADLMKTAIAMKG